MKNLSFGVVVTLAFLFLSCKKEKNSTAANSTAANCACNSTEIKYRLENQAGNLIYFSSKNKWVFVYQPMPGNYSNYFPCNPSQDSLIAILQGANTSQTFNVKISGKVKSTCPDEYFGVSTAQTTVDYIFIDSLKRN